MRPCTPQSLPTFQPTAGRPGRLAAAVLAFCWILLPLTPTAGFADGPRAAGPRPDVLSVPAGGPTTIEVSALLANDALPSKPGWNLLLAESPEGLLAFDGETLVYDPGDLFGEDRFSYRLDGRDLAEVTIHVRPAYQPVIGDWDCDRSTDVGWFEAETSTFMLCQGDDLGACRAHALAVGELGWSPLVGDWNAETCADFAVYDPATGRLFVQESASSWRLREVLGPAGAYPFALDRDGDGLDEIGFYRSDSARIWWLGSAVPQRFAPSVAPLDGGLPLAGDWNGDGLDELAVYQPSTGRVVFEAAGDAVFELLPASRYAFGWPIEAAPDAVGLYDLASRRLVRHRWTPVDKECTGPGCPCVAPDCEECEDPPFGSGCEERFTPPPNDPPHCQGQSCGI